MDKKQVLQDNQVYAGASGYFYRLALDKDNNWQVYFARNEEVCKTTNSTICSKTINYRHMAEELMIEYGCKPLH